MMVVTYRLRSAMILLLMMVSNASAVRDYHVTDNHLTEMYTDQLSHHSTSATIYKSDVAEYTKMVKVDPEEGLLFYWNVNEEYLDVRIVFQGHAWLGFGVSKGEEMDESEVVIGKPRSKHIRKYSIFGGDWKNAEKLEHKYQTLFDQKIVQTKTTTTMSFKKLLEEDGEIAIKPSGLNNLLFVFGKGNTSHNSEGSFHLKLNLSKHAEDSYTKHKSGFKYKSGSKNESTATDKPAPKSESIPKHESKPEEDKLPEDKSTSKDESSTKNAASSKGGDVSKYDSTSKEVAPSKDVEEKDHELSKTTKTIIGIFSSVGIVSLIALVSVGERMISG